MFPCTKWQSARRRKQGEDDEISSAGPMRKHVLSTFIIFRGFLFLSLIKNSRTASFRLHLPPRTTVKEGSQSLIGFMVVSSAACTWKLTVREIDHRFELSWARCEWDWCSLTSKTLPIIDVDENKFAALVYFLFSVFKLIMTSFTRERDKFDSI